MGISNNSKSGGIGFCGLLTISFIVLKLTNYINWSWWWVLSPLWIPITVLLIITLIIIILKVVFGSKAKCEIKKSGFASRLEKMQADQDRMRENMKHRK